MKTESIKIDQLIFPERNVRIHGKKQLKGLQESITMFGQIRPAVIDENNVILAGNGIVKALLEMGKETTEVYRVVGLSENEKKKLMLADNKTFSLGVDNIETIYEFIEELGTDLQIPGYDEELLQSMVATAEEVTEQLSEYGKLDQESLKKIEQGKVKKEEWANQEKDRDIEKEQENIQEEVITYKEDDTSSIQPILLKEEDSKSISEEEREENKPYITCPKCGEKIWL